MMSICIVTGLLLIIIIPVIIPDPASSMSTALPIGKAWKKQSARRVARGKASRTALAAL